jgi:hypothetical protein
LPDAALVCSAAFADQAAENLPALNLGSDIDGAAGSRGVPAAGHDVAMSALVCVASSKSTSQSDIRTINK